MNDHSDVNPNDNLTAEVDRVAPISESGQQADANSGPDASRSCVPVSAEGTHPDATEDPSPNGLKLFRSPHLGTDQSWHECFSIGIRRSGGRKRRQLEGRHGPSPLYFQLTRHGTLTVYLDRELAHEAGIAPRDKVNFSYDRVSPERFALMRSYSGWQIKELSRSSDLLFLAPTISTYSSKRHFHSFAFGENDTLVPTEVKIAEEEGRKFIDFTLPDILPPPNLQSHPLVLTRAYRNTILNLDQALAAEAGILPNHVVTFGCDEDQHPEKLLVFHDGDRHRKDHAYPAAGRWLHHRQNLGEFNAWFFPAGTTHLTPEVRVGDCSFSPFKPPMKVLVVSIDPTPGHAWATIARRLRKPFSIGGRAAIPSQEQSFEVNEQIAPDSYEPILPEPTGQAEEVESDSKPAHQLDREDQEVFQDFASDPPESSKP